MLLMGWPSYKKTWFVSRRRTFAKSVSTNRTAGVSGTCLAFYLYKPDFKRAEEMFRQGISLNESIDHKKGLAANFNGLAIVYLERGEDGKAFAAAFKSFGIYKEFPRGTPNPPSGIALVDTINTLGRSYSRLGDQTSAERMYCNAQEIHRDLKNEEGIAKSYYLLGELYEKRDEKSTSRSLYRASLKKHLTGLGLSRLCSEVEEFIARFGSSPHNNKESDIHICGGPFPNCEATVSRPRSKHLARMVRRVVLYACSPNGTVSRSASVRVFNSPPGGLVDTMCRFAGR